MKRHTGLDDELRPEYDLSELPKGGTRRIFGPIQRGYKLVLQAPDVAQAFLMMKQ